jgi:mono/diheme cytochrome c family protein
MSVRRIASAAVAAAVLAAPAAAAGQARPPAAAAGPEGIDGATLFATACGWCHQAGGRAAGRGPKLAGNPQSDEYLLNRIKAGKQGAMPAYRSVFTEAQLRAILSYIRSLRDDGR